LLLLIVKEMRTLQPHQILHVLAYDPGAAEDIPAWCRTTQNSLIYQTPSQDRLQPSHFYIRKKGMAPIVKATG
jgi:tRNA 2-thiouridine synthesizing protein A